MYELHSKDKHPRWTACAERWIDVAIEKSAQEQLASMTPPEERQISEKLGGMEKMKEIVKENIMANEDVKAIFEPDF